MVTVGAGAILGGTGSFGAGILANGILAPGNSIGTMAVTGPLTFGAGATYRVEANAAGQADRIDVTGTATLAGTVEAVPEAGSYAFQTDYTILTANRPDHHRLRHGDQHLGLPRPVADLRHQHGDPAADPQRHRLRRCRHDGEPDGGRRGAGRRRARGERGLRDGAGGGHQPVGAGRA